MRKLPIKRPLWTKVRVPFKAVCPVPDPPRYYHAEAVISYWAEYEVFDFNDLAAAIRDYVAVEQRSVEDVVVYARSLVDSESDNASVSVEIPAQEGHLAVVVETAD